MKIKTALILSLIVNAVLLGTFGYLHSTSVEPLKSPPIIYSVNQSGDGALGTALEAIAGETVAP